MINKGLTQRFYTDLKAEIKFILQIESRLCVSESHSVLSDSLWPPGLYSPWHSIGQNTLVGSLSLLQGIFPIQGSNSGLPHCRQILYQLSYKGRLRILEWVAYPSCPLFNSLFFGSNRYRRGSTRPLPKQMNHSQEMIYYILFSCSHLQSQSEVSLGPFLFVSKMVRNNLLHKHCILYWCMYSSILSFSSTDFSLNVLGTEWRMGAG